MHKPRVLIVDRIPAHVTDVFGGTRTYAISLARRLGGEGYPIGYVVNAGLGSEELLERFANIGASVAAVDFANTSLDEVRRVTSRTACEKTNTIVQINSGAREVRDFVFRTSDARNKYVRRILTMHGPLGAACLPVNPRLKDRLPFSYRWRTTHKDRTFANRMNKIVSVSERHGETLKQTLRLPDSLVESIPNGVDTHRFRPRTQTKKKDRVVVGSAGRLVKGKQFDTLIDVVGLLSRELPIQLRIAGSGNLLYNLKEHARNRRIEHLVDFVGACDDMPGFYRSLDVFCMVSKNEGLPYVQLEAMASGLPSVVTDVGDLPRVVRDGKDGLVAADGTTSAIANCLKRLMTDPRLRQKMGDCARMRVCKHYSQQQCESKTLDVFREVAESF